LVERRLPAACRLDAPLQVRLDQRESTTSLAVLREPAPSGGSNPRTVDAPARAPEVDRSDRFLLDRRPELAALASSAGPGDARSPSGWDPLRVRLGSREPREGAADRRIGLDVLRSRRARHSQPRRRWPLLEMQRSRRARAFRRPGGAARAGLPR